jgi:hypothetical protein
VGEATFGGKCLALGMGSGVIARSFFGHKTAELKRRIKDLSTLALSDDSMVSSPVRCGVTRPF